MDRARRKQELAWNFPKILEYKKRNTEKIQIPYPWDDPLIEGLNGAFNPNLLKYLNTRIRNLAEIYCMRR